MIDPKGAEAAALASEHGVTLCDPSLPDMPLVFVNPAFEKLTGYSFDEVVGRNCRFLQGADTGQEDQRQIIREAIKNKKPVKVTLKNYRKDGTAFWNELTISPVFDDAGHISIYLGIQKDITNMVEMRDALTEKDEKLEFQKFAFDQHAIVSIANAAGTITYVNERFCEITGYAREELIGQNHRMIKSGKHPEVFFDEIWSTISSGLTWHGEICNTTKSGEDYWVSTTIVPKLNPQGKPVEYIGIRTDITNRKEAEAQLELIAYYDPLTGLPNSILLEKLLSAAMIECDTTRTSLAVAIVNLDNFKAVNSAFGSDGGDQVLMTLSKRFQEALPADYTIARLKGDDFCIIMPHVKTVVEGSPTLDKILKVAAENVILESTEVSVSASIGATIYPEDRADLGGLMRHADQAMYLAKNNGKNQFYFFNITEEITESSKRQIRDELRGALRNEEFMLYFQPRVNMRTHEIIGVEALIRWQHPERGIVPPLDFLPATENHSISLEIGDWVINTALDQISRWQDQGLDLPISVNISAHHLMQKGFIDGLKKLLGNHPTVKPNRLELEILEHNALTDLHKVADIINDCAKLGVDYAIDDFGTGFSTLTYLRHLPAQTIKIDQSFVQDMLENENDAAIVEAIIALAKLFRRKVIAEGVETIAHGEELMKLGCDLAQGYGIAKPMPEAAIFRWVSQWKGDWA